MQPSSYYSYAVNMARYARRSGYTEKERDRFQGEVLRRLVRHAARDVPLYRRIYREHDLDPDGIDGLDDIFKIPMVNKDLVRGAGDDALSVGLAKEKLVGGSTSGTSGRLLRVYHTPWDAGANALGYDLALVASGYRILKDRVLHGASPATTRVRRWYHRFGIRRRTYFRHDDRPSNILKLISSFKPHVIYTTPPSMEIIAREALETAQTRWPRLRLIFVPGERIYPEGRRMVREAFGVDPTSIYGGWEAGLIGYQCPARDGFHVDWQSVILEVLRDGEPVGPGERGEVVITNVNSWAMPFIRYRLADVAVVSSGACSCGYDGPLLDRVEGRLNDFVTLRDGRILSSELFISTLRFFIDWLADFRLIQEDYEDFELLLVPVPGKEPDPVAAAEKIGEIIGDPSVAVRARVVDAMPRGEKRKAIMSKVPCPLSAAKME